MAIRWKRWAGGAAAAVALYAAVGFWVVPWAAKRQLASYASEQLQRQASVGELAFNPFTLRLEAKDLQLAEANGSPVFGIGRLLVQMQWRSLISRAWRFADIQLDAPSANLVIAKDGRFNIAELVDAATRGSQPSNDTSLPRLVIDRFAIQQGRVEMQDLHAGYANALAPIQFEITDFSTLPDRNDAYTFTAQSKQGGTVHWKGHASVNPIRADGQLAIEDAPLPQLSVYLKSKVRATVAAGKLSATIPYALSYVDGRFEARLTGAKLAASDLGFAREGGTNSFASLTQLAATGIDADLVQRDFKVAGVRAAHGKLALRRDPKGNLDLANLMVEAAGPAAQPPDGNGKVVQASDWKAAVGKVVLDDVALSAVDETVNPPLKLDVASVGAQVALDAGQHGDAFELKLANGSLALAGVAVAKGSEPPQEFERAGFEGATLDLAAHRAVLDRAWLEGGKLHVTRDKQGAIDVASWIPKAGPAAPNAGSKATPARWTATARSLQLARIEADVSDEQTGVTLHAFDVHGKVDGAGTDLKQPIRFVAGVALREGGELSAEGSVVPATAAVQAQVRANRLALKPLQPLLAQYVKLKIATGEASVEGKVTTGSGTRASPTLRYDGSFDVDKLSIRELDDDAFGSWRKVAAARMVASFGPNRLEIPELRVAGADAKLQIEEDRSFNAARLVVPRAPAAAKAASAASAEETFPVRIRRVRIEDAKLDFTDLSLKPQFSAKIQELNGVVNGLSTSRSARAQIELDGRVDEYGSARIRGETSLAAPKDNTDVTFTFRNIDMVPASPYAMKFAGYRIAEGKMSLDLQYKIRDSKLEGDNRIVLDRLTLGERVDSPDALKLPIQLAIALLKDADGRIDLGLPVSGDLSDPKFSYTAIIWKAVTNVITKIVTAPFRALGAMFGVDSAKLESVDFDAGSSVLLPPEREKLKKVAEVLGKREALKLSIPGQYSPAADGAALRAQAVRREVALQAGVKLAPGERAGPLDFGDRTIRTALREVYAKRFGDAELEKAKKEAESAPVAAPAASSASESRRSALPLWQRAAKMIQGEPQVADASAFYTHLRERLEREEPLPADALPQLGAERAKNVATALGEMGVDAARFTVAPPAPAESPAGKTVALKFGLAPR